MLKCQNLCVENSDVTLMIIWTMQVGGPYWDVPLGRKDSVTASLPLAESNLPAPNEGLGTIISKFLYQGLSVTDMVALSGNQLVKLWSIQ